MKLMILDLPRSASENDLAALFKKFGNIKSCTLVMDKTTGKSKGFGFVEMALKHEGSKAVEALNNSQFKDKKIRVKPAN